MNGFSSDPPRVRFGDGFFAAGHGGGGHPLEWAILGLLLFLVVLQLGTLGASFLQRRPRQQVVVERQPPEPPPTG